MNMEFVRSLLEDALQSGLQLHGTSVNGRPAISFDYENPAAEIARRKFRQADGLVRELLRAAMIEECRRRGLPENLPSRIPELDHEDPNRVIH